jgi:hypothetical protein
MRLKIVFVTLVYDGMPFLRHHPTVFSKLKIPWEWHVVEGVAMLRHDTAWSLAQGGRIPPWAVKNSLSTDGTTEFLDGLKEKYPKKFFLYRKPQGKFWDGKIEMERAYLPALAEPCLLWEMSSDELWAPWQIEKIYGLFLENPHKNSAHFWCNFYIGPEAVISSRHGYSQDSNIEWHRVYRYQPGDAWLSHEPNVLIGRRPPWFRKVNVGSYCPFTHEETEAVGAVFDHFAYATREQVRFKETYYGYGGLLKKWSSLQRDVQYRSPRRLSQYFPWVHDHTTVSTPQAMGLKPLAREAGGKWYFRRHSKPALSALAGKQILLDGSWVAGAKLLLGQKVFGKVLDQWSRDGFARYIQVLESAGLEKTLPGLKIIRFSKLKYLSGPWAGFFLERICRRHRIDLMVLGSENKPLLTKYLNMQFHKRHRFSCKGRGTSTLHRFIPDASGIKSAKLFRRLFVDALMR